MPDLQEMLNDPRAAQEGLQKAQQLSPEHLAELVKVQKNEAEQATSELRQQWKQNYRLWQNQVYFRDKEEWQTKLWVPKVFAAVEQATAIIQRSLLETSETFGMGGYDERDRMLASQVWKPMLKIFLNQAGLPYKFADGAKMGFITGVAGYFKIRPTIAKVPKLMGVGIDPMTGRPQPQFTYGQRSYLSIETVAPWNIFRDPVYSVPRRNYSGSFLYHSEWKDKGALREMGAAGWDMNVLNELLATRDRGTGNSWASNSQREDAELKQQRFETHKFRWTYLVDEGWLDILDENGEVVFPNALMVHSNGKILYGPVDNPIWATDLNTGRRKWPFVAGTPIVHPTRFEGRGIVEQDAALASLYSNVLMLWADGLNWVVNPPTEIHQDALVDWEDLSHYPGKLWVKHTDKPALTPAQIGKMNTNEVMSALEYIDRQRQNVNFVNDNVVGLPGSRSEITKGEVQIKTAQSMAIFEAMGKNLEHLGKEIVELSYDLLLQFFDDYSDPSVERIMGPELAQLLSMMPLEAKVESLQGNFDFNFTGVSDALLKADKLQKVVQFATLAASPAYMGMVSSGELLKYIGELLGIDDRVQISDAPPPMMPGQPGMPQAGPPQGMQMPEQEPQPEQMQQGQSQMMQPQGA